MAALDMMRPHTSLGFNGSQPDMVDPNVKVADNILTSGFKKHLADFYHKATPEDRARCLELLTSIEIGENIKEQAKYLPDPDPTSLQYPIAGVPSNHNRQKRPKTAMAEYGTRKDPINPYMTTYKREYTANPGAPGYAERPQTSRHQINHELSAPLGSTTYQNEFYGKKSKAIPFRTGTSSGNRRNNPHPREAFMVWKLPNQLRSEQPYSEWSTELTDDVMDNVMRGKLASTYQQDYLGIPQGYQVKGAFAEKEDWKARIPYTLDTSTRYTFQKPDQKPELKGNTLRYGCNKIKHVPALGVVPTISSRPHMNIKARTTYEREYNSMNGPITRDVRDMSRHLGANTLEKYLPGAGYQEKETLGRMIHTLRPHPPHQINSRSSSVSSQRIQPCVPCTTCLDSPVATPSY